MIALSVEIWSCCIVEKVGPCKHILLVKQWPVYLSVRICEPC